VLRSSSSQGIYCSSDHLQFPATSLESTKLFFLGLLAVLLRCTKSVPVAQLNSSESPREKKLPWSHTAPLQSLRLQLSILLVKSHLFSQPGPITYLVRAIHSHNRNSFHSCVSPVLYGFSSSISRTKQDTMQQATRHITGDTRLFKYARANLYVLISTGKEKWRIHFSSVIKAQNDHLGKDCPHFPTWAAAYGKALQSKNLGGQGHWTLQYSPG